MCLTWFPNWFVYENPIYNTNRFVLQELGKVAEVSDCEELVGVTHRMMMGLVLEGYCFTPFTNFPMMFPSLSYSVTFQGSSTLNSPTNSPPSGKVSVP